MELEYELYREVPETVPLSIYEQGGNAIMSAIDFGLDVDVTEEADGTHRVVIRFDGKLLPYAKKGKHLGIIE